MLRCTEALLDYQKRFVVDSLFFFSYRDALFIDLYFISLIVCMPSVMIAKYLLLPVTRNICAVIHLEMIVTYYTLVLGIIVISLREVH